MLAPRTTLAAAAASGLLALAFAVPASADTLAPQQMTCFQAQAQLINDQHALTTAVSRDRSDDNTAVNGSADFTPDAADQAVTAAQAVVNTDTQTVNALCGTSLTPNPGGVSVPPVTGHRFPRPIIVAPPAATVPSCAQLAAIGQSNIPIGSRYYYAADDSNGNGVACESSATNTTIPFGTVQVVQGHKCRWSGTAWVPVVPVTPAPTPAPVTVIETAPPAATAPNPCNCTVTAPAPPVVTVPAPAPAPATQTIVEQVPVTVPPAQTFVNPTPPSTAMVDTGDGSVFGGLASAR